MTKSDFEALQEWCTAILGPFQIQSDHSKAHGAHESSTLCLQTAAGTSYLKIHQTPAAWHQEVHAYEQWAGAFGALAPRLIAVHAEPPLALILGELPGQVLEKNQLSPSQERAIWRTAGAALVALHDLGAGECFGPCLRDGACAGEEVSDAVEYLSTTLSGEIDRALRARLIDREEQATLHAAYGLIPAFAGERPTPCHRDYCAPNSLVNAQGALCGVINFEFSYWDVRVADFSRDPDWAWYRRPELVTAFFEGYGRPFNPAGERQLLVSRADYALSAILWGHTYAYYGFEQEGRDALLHLRSLLR